MSRFRAVNARPFVLFMIGTFISGIGDNLYGIAIAWWIADQIGSAELMGNALGLSFLPRVIFLLLGGVIGDRLPRMWMLLAQVLLKG